MSDSFQFPKNPLDGTQNRFSDEQGNNPFAEADGNAATDASLDNVYATTAAETVGDERPEYELTLKTHGMTWTLLSGSVLVVSVIAAVMVQYAPVAVVFAIATGAAALVLLTRTASNLSAIRSGAMSAHGTGLVKVALALSIASGITTTIAIALFILQFFG